MGRTVTKRAIISADDFGLSEAVNEGIERAHREGILRSASLMMGAPAAEDAVRRARRLPALRVGLHLVVIEGPAVLPPNEIPGLVDEHGQFPSDQLRLGVRYAFLPAVRRQLAREIRAQFAAFAATGLTLDHANAHKHMHLHPVVGHLLTTTGRQFGLRAVRVPNEPPTVLAACGTQAGTGDRLLFRFTSLLRHQAHRQGLAVNDHCFGLAWSGHMTAERICALAPHLPPGVSEIYFHPASRRDAALDRLMPAYEHEAEMQALIAPEVREGLSAARVELIGYDALTRDG
jgi:chitin disaccharide deacetylase